MPIKIWFDATGEQTVVDPANLEFFDFGGQGQIYRWVYREELYVVKVVPRDESVFRRLNQIREAVESYAKRAGIQVPEGIARRGFPAGRGFVENPEELGFDSGDQLMAIVYRWIDGEPLDRYLETVLAREPPLSPARISLAKQLLDLLIVLEKAGVANYDMFPDNFIVDEYGKVYVIDMEGAGLFDPVTRRWIWLPIALGKNFPGYCRPPEFLLSSNDDDKVFSYRWIGTQLLFHILVGVTPFAFMQRLDLQALQDLYSVIDRNVVAWPPYGAEYAKYLNPRLSPTRFRQWLRNVCRAGGTEGVCPLEKLAFLALAYGFDKPFHRPSFEFAKLLLSGVLLS